MHLTYTADQLIRETQLLVTSLSLLVEFVVEDGAGPRALGLDADGHFAQTRHPDDLSEIQDMEVWQHISRIESYVRDQQWHDAIPTDVRYLGLIVERIFSQEVIREYEEERAHHQDVVVVPGPHEEGAGDVPLGFFYRGILADLVALATARLKVDRDERLTLSDIALLLGMREQTVITNAHRKNFPTVEDDNRRYAESTGALEWMHKQGYLPTRKPAGKDEKAAAHGVPPADETLLFVPYARDGSWFGPDCSSAGRYTIGAKGSEVKYTDYFAALDALLKMPTPRWRRKNSNGIQGIVAGVRFDRVRRADIERALR